MTHFRLNSISNADFENFYQKMVIRILPLLLGQYPVVYFQTQPVTPRTLETMIRLSTAHAKARISRLVTAEDARAAIELIQYAYFKTVLEREKKRRRKDEDSESDGDEEVTQRPKRSRRLVSSLYSNSSPI